MLNSLRNKVVVITGASNGIGRELALQLAKKRACLMLVARNETALAELALRCRRRGATVSYARVDVCDEGELRQVAARTAKRFGRIDAWINNAGVQAFGKFEDIPADVFRKVVETNFFGVVNGARAVLPFFRAQRRGNLINVSSVEGKVAAPYASAYVASKFGIGGFSESLRMELLDSPGIRVCTLYPATIDTPFFHHAANYSGSVVRPIKPVYSVQSAARALISLIKHPRAEAYVGSAGRRLVFLKRVSPRTAEYGFKKRIEHTRTHRMPSSSNDGNVFVPDHQLIDSRGGWGGRDTRREKFASLLGLVTVGAIVARLAIERFLQPSEVAKPRYGDEHATQIESTAAGE